MNHGGPENIENEEVLQRKIYEILENGTIKKEKEYPIEMDHDEE
jgi:hypothetical protein